MEGNWLLKLLIKFFSACLTKYLCECSNKCLGRSFSKCSNIWLNLCLSKSFSFFRASIRLITSLLQFSVEVPNWLTT